MNTSTAISVENVSKRFMLSQKTERYTALRDVLANPFKKKKKDAVASDFWALNGVSFSVEKGERLGIIGRNGAGKSTLLKVLSRIIAPTQGRVEIQGRLASLLEVGTGFHPELSGRENIYLNGAILGMSRTEISQRFDEIVAFAEVSKFLDTPVKRYSSGMYTRLAFAVAAHLESEVLIIDEVLAVGDAQFQKKCLGKMQELSVGHGRTILFVSHNMGAIRTFCNKCLYLDAGKVLKYGEVNEILPLYFGLGNRIQTDGIQVTASPEHESGEWIGGSFIRIEIKWEAGRFPIGWHADIACYSLEGEKLFALQSHTMPGFMAPHVDSNGIVFRVMNTGLVDREIRLDVGIRKSEHVPYDIVLENVLLLSPSNKNIEFNRVPDVLMVPEATCIAL